MAGVADLLIRMSMDSRAVSTGADQVEGKLTGAAQRGQRAFQALAAGGIGIAAVQLFQLGVEAESWQRKFDTVFGEAGGIVAEWADQFNERFGQSEERLRGVAAGVGDLLVPLGLTRTEAANTSTEVLELAAALSEWKGGAISVEETTNILTRAVLGERDALIGLGVKISEEEVKARLLEKGMKDLTGTALGQAKAMVTLELITERSADAMTAFASGGSEALLAQNALKAAIDTLKVTLGEAVTALAPLISGFASLLTVMGKVDGLIPGVAAGLAALALGLGPVGALFVAIGVAGATSRNTAIDFEALVNAGKKLDRSFREAEAAAELFRRQLADMGMTSDDAHAAFGDLVKQFFRLTDAAEEVTETVDGATDSIVGFADALLAQASPAFAAQQAAENYRKVLAQISEDGEIAASEQLELAEAVLKAQAALDVFSADGINAEVNAIALALNISQAEARNLLTTLGLIDGTHVRAIIDVTTRLTAGTGPIESMQHGGPLAARHLALVGEKGPELFRPNISGQIIPNSRIGQFGGTPTININVGGSIISNRELLSYVRQGLREYAQAGGSLQL